ncbi:MAG: hypothetical protein J6W42_00125 [Bacteroidaceae bacterium]|nr:hypothetical protein [Bacteroidaceae bacterium]
MEFDPSKIEALCKEREEKILKGYFGDLVKEAAIERPEFIGKKYQPDLPYKIESEYKEYLDFLVRQLFPGNDIVNVNSFLDEEKLRKLMTDDDREGIEVAYKKATRRNVVERIANTNHKDVTFYKGLLEAHAKDLLFVMRTDFLEELTGKFIKNKTFEKE